MGLNHRPPTVSSVGALRRNLVRSPPLSYFPVAPLVGFKPTTSRVITPSALSLSYYEQAVQQLGFLLRGDTIRLPLRVIGLMADRGVTQPAELCEYHEKRHSRTLVDTKSIAVQVGSAERPRERERIVIVPGGRTPARKR